MNTTRIDHTACSHPRNAAGRRACRNAVARGTTLDMTPARSAEIDRSVAAISAAFDAARPTINTPAGKIRVGSIIIASVLGDENETCVILNVSDDIKNGYAGWDADGRWGYADQVVRVIKF